MSKRMMVLMALVLVGGLTVAACGGTTAEPTAATNIEAPTEVPGAAETMPTVAVAATTIEAKTLDTFVFEPNAWEVPAGSLVDVKLDNAEGTMEHSWELLTKDTTPEKAITLTEADTANILFSLKAPAGQQASGTFTAPTEPGDYVVVCIIPGHAAGGMTGTLTVK